jgi:hypothetical protein
MTRGFSPENPVTRISIITQLTINERLHNEAFLCALVRDIDAIVGQTEHTESQCLTIGSGSALCICISDEAVQPSKSGPTSCQNKMFANSD